MSQPPPHQSADHHAESPERHASPAPGPQPVVGPPNKHELAVMIWVAVFPTLTALNLTLGPWLAPFNPILRTFTLATIAVPVVIYGLMPRLHALRGKILIHRATWPHPHKSPGVPCRPRPW